MIAEALDAEIAELEDELVTIGLARLAEQRPYTEACRERVLRIEHLKALREHVEATDEP